MKKTIYLSLVTVISLQATEQLADINITEQIPINTKVVKNVSGEEVKSADLADALSRKVPSVSLIRRSGIANDITLRGQKRDNINVTIDGAKICGACVNRMDPPTSHVVTHAIDDIEIKEGPFDVEEFGVLSGSVKVTTRKPQKEIGGEVSLNVGSFGYKKASGTVTGGTDKVRFLLSASTEEGEQYEDGNGDDFSEQLANYTEDKPDIAKFNYSSSDKGMDAFKKSMYMGKIFVDITDDQELKFSYTANRSEDVLYPSSKMDADYDDSDMLNLEYSINNLSSFSKKLEIQLYNSEVDHPMSTRYRNVGQTKYMTHHLTTEMTGAKLKNSVDAFGGELTYGVDTSKRNWDGKYTVTTVDGSKPVMTIGKSIDDVDTDNVGIFLKGKKQFGAVELEGGLRYDDTTIDTSSATEQDTDYKSTSASLFASYRATKDTKLFVGVGKSNRVPDARELYNTKYNTTVKPAKRVLNGTPSLNQTTNYELDVGVEQYFPNGQIKLKTFYSELKDYIYYNGNPQIKKNNFENIDATIYGAELSGTYLASDSLYFDAGLSYKRGKKDTLTRGQTDDDLADISPLKLNASATYDYDDAGNIQLSFVAVDRWSDIDSENGEQELAGYGVVNFKTSREFDNGLILLFGVDNLLDKRYTTTNTYKDLILMTDNSDTMLINEPGRYIYLNGTYQF